MLSVCIIHFPWKSREYAELGSTTARNLYIRNDLKVNQVRSQGLWDGIYRSVRGLSQLIVDAQYGVSKRDLM